MFNNSLNYYIRIKKFDLMFKYKTIKNNLRFGNYERIYGKNWETILELDKNRLKREIKTYFEFKNDIKQVIEKIGSSWGL